MPEQARTARTAVLPILLACAVALAGCSSEDRQARLSQAGSDPSLQDLLRIADAGAGARVFRQCAACHTIGRSAPDRAGPNLFGVMGRPVAGSPTYGYTHALKAVGGRWTVERMDAWLAHPAGFAPGTSMRYPGLSDALDRADVIAYLRTQSDQSEAAR